MSERSDEERAFPSGNQLSEKTHNETEEVQRQLNTPSITIFVRHAEVDEAAKFLSDKHDDPFNSRPTAAQSQAVLRKIDRRVMTLLMLTFLVQFIDKTALANSSILGLLQDTHLTQEQYNWLTTAFYLSYCLFEWPQNLLLQKLPTAQFLAVNILLWGLLTILQIFSTSFHTLFALRFLLGASESVVISGCLLLTSMFYTHDETTSRVAGWNLMNGVAQVVNALVAFGAYHVPSTGRGWRPWKYFMVVNGGLSLAVGVLFWVFVPDNPMRARFLSEREKVVAVRRLEGRSSGVESRRWKRGQFLEAVTDWKSLAFAAYAAVSNVSNSSFNMMALIIESFGFTTEQTTLLGGVNGVVEILGIVVAIVLALKYTNHRAYIAAWFALPNILSALMLIFLPWSAKGALLSAIYISFLGGPDFILLLSWAAATTTGHTKRTTTNAMILIGYAIGNLLSPHMWQEKYAPRYYVPWGIILATYVLRPVGLVVVRGLLVRENRRRDVEQESEGRARFVDDETGREVDVTFLDMTDRENRGFRYPL